MRKGWLSITVIVMLLTGCTQFGSDSAMDVEERKAEAALLDSRLAETTNQLGIKLFSQLSEEQSGNLTISPYSISTALALAYNGSAGDTAAELGKLLGYKPAEMEKLNADHEALLKLMKNAGTGIELKLANSIWGGKDVPLRKEYLRTGENFYDAELRTTDFTGEESVNEINKWVSEQTEQKIQKMLEKPPGVTAVALLVNAIYFKGSWKEPFLERNTEQTDFYLPDDTAVKVAMMKQSGGYQYAESENWQAIRLPYGEGQMDMLVILPTEAFSLTELQTELAEGSFPSEPEFTKREGTIRLPRFKASYGNDLVDAVRALGVKDAFDPALADFSSIADTSDPIFISKIVHKTFIEVNEQGTEAAAATLIETMDGAAPPPEKPFEMTVDRPFLYIIEDRQSDVWLFLGVIENPVAVE